MLRKSNNPFKLVDYAAALYKYKTSKSLQRKLKHLLTAAATLTGDGNIDTDV
jgi:hypothetical protein